MNQSLRVSASPHVRDARSTTKVMLDVIIALVPAGVVGVVNMEFIVNDSGAWFLEVNPRFSGGVGFSVLAGVDFPALNLLCHAGEAIGSRAPVREMTLARRSSPAITEI